MTYRKAMRSHAIRIRGGSDVLVVSAPSCDSGCVVHTSEPENILPREGECLKSIDPTRFCSAPCHELPLDEQLQEGPHRAEGPGTYGGQP